jgi:hypothetical protein
MHRKITVAAIALIAYSPADSSSQARSAFMRLILSVSVVLGLGCLAPFARGEESLKGLEALEGLEPVMVDVTDRDKPSEAEWDALHEDSQRAAFMGGVGDFKSRSIAFMNTRYFTANAPEATLASYGKMGADQRYDRFGQIEGLQFSVEQNSWKTRSVVNATALFNLVGSRFMEFAGVGVDAAVDKKLQIEVTFFGTNVPKDEAIRRLNVNVDALEYFDALQQKRAAHGKEKLKLLAGKAPPAPKVVLSNVVMLDGNFSQAMNASIDGKLHNRVVGDAVELKVVKKNGEELRLLSPVVRCYRTYSVEFRTDAEGRPIRVVLRGRDGREHQVPQIFDLTPDT